jgi:hypothetical protein
MPPPACSRDATLDALAMTEAVLRQDWPALTAILDAGDNRAQASMAASMFAVYLAHALGGAAGALTHLAGVRPDLLAGHDHPGESPS